MVDKQKQNANAKRNKIIKICYFVVYAIMFADLILRVNLIKIGINPPLETIYYESKSLIILIEVVFLLSAFSFYLFVSAKKGMFAKITSNYESFSKKKFSLMSLIIALSISFFAFTPRLIITLADPTFYYEYPAWSAVVFVGFFYFLVALITFLFCYLLFYAAFEKAKAFHVKNKIE